MEKRKSEDEDHISKKLKANESKPEFESLAGYILPSETEIALNNFRKKFPKEKFCNKIPPLIFVHQLYHKISTPPAQIKQEINRLQKDNKLKLLKVSPDLSLVFFVDDLEDVVYSTVNPSGRPKHFLHKVLPTLESCIVEKSVLKNEYKFSDKDITDLVQFGLLVLNLDSTYTVTFPAFGQFMKIFYDARNTLITAIKKSKYRELLISEIKGRSLKPLDMLGLDYHLSDVLGAKLLISVDTSSGPLLRLPS